MLQKKFKLTILLLSILIFISNCTELPPNRVITGVAYKEDGTPFGKTATVIAVDSSGKCAFGKIDDKGNYRVFLPASAIDPLTGKGTNLINGVDGNTFLQVSDGENVLSIVASEFQGQINVNVFTSVASQLLINKTKTNLEPIFSSAKTAAMVGKDGRGQIIDTVILQELDFVEILTEEKFFEATKIVVGAIFGYDTLGNNIVSSQKLMFNSPNEDIVMLQVAASITNDFLNSCLKSCNNSEDALLLFGNEKFYESISRELAKNDSVITTNPFGDFLNIVVINKEFKKLIEPSVSELNTFVNDIRLNNNTVFKVKTPTLSQPDSAAIFNISRQVDLLTCSLTNGIKGDLTTFEIFTTFSSKEKIRIMIPLVWNGEIFVLGVKPIVVEYRYFVANIQSSAAVFEGNIHLDLLFQEANINLIELYAYSNSDIPNTAKDLPLAISCDSLQREDFENIIFYITDNLITASSIAGVILE